MMKDWQDLYKSLGGISIDYLIYQKRDNIEQSKKIIPQIQKFVLWFLEENRYGIEAELYQGLSQNLVNILADILEALEQEDMVLMHDALTYGLLEYLELIVVNLKQEELVDDDV